MRGNVLIELVERHVADGGYVVARQPKGIAPQLVTEFIIELPSKHPGRVGLKKVDVFGQLGAWLGRDDQMDVVVGALLLYDADTAAFGDIVGKLFETSGNALVTKDILSVLNTDYQVVPKRVHRIACFIELSHRGK